MGGAYVQIFQPYVTSAPSPDQWGDCAVLYDFFESTNFNEMAPHDELASGASKWVLAKPGQSYIAYSDGGSGDFGIQGMTAGTYTLSWLDIPTGTKRTAQQTVTAGTNTFSRPSGIGTGEVAVWISTGGTQDPPELTSAVVSPESATILKDKSFTFAAQGKDQYGQNISASFNWTVSGGGTVSNGTFTSNGTSGTFTVTAATTSNSAIKDSAHITVISEYPAPTAGDRTLTTSLNQPAGLSLPYESQSPGPFEFTITKQPDNGTLEVVGNDAEYTPNTGFTGTDTYKWQVKDTFSNKLSNEATVTIHVVDKVTVTVVEYLGSGTPPSVVADGFVDGATQANDRSGSQWTSVPASLSGLTYLLTARNDKSDALGENSVIYRVSISAPCTVFAIMDQSAGVPTWIASDNWQATSLSVTGDGQAHMVYQKVFQAGTIDLKRQKDGGSQGTGYVFKPGSAPSVEILDRNMGQDKTGLLIIPNPFNSNIKIKVRREAYGVQRVSLQIYNVRGKLVADLTPYASRITPYAYTWNAADYPSGTYLVHAAVGTKSLTRRIALVK
jgi:hypothetical protein